MQTILIAIIASYFLGSIPTSIVAGKLLRGIDIRAYGSGNAGAANTYRLLGPVPGVVVMLIDLLKGLVAVLWVSHLSSSSTYLSILAGFSAILGHIFPLFVGFRGGKGVSTTIGALLGLAPATTLVAGAIFFGVVALTRYVSLGSLAAVNSIWLILVIKRFLFHQEVEVAVILFSIVIAVVMAMTLRSNIKRLLAGVERKLGERQQLDRRSE